MTNSLISESRNDSESDNDLSNLPTHKKGRDDIDKVDTNVDDGMEEE